MERRLAIFGVVFLMVGMWTGYLIHAFPEGANPAYPFWVAMLVPAAFALSGLHMVTAALGLPRLARVTVQAGALCVLAIVNWAAFFTTHVQCIMLMSFLGTLIVARHPGDAECLIGLRVIVASIDAFILLPAIWFAWRKRRDRFTTPPNNHRR